MNFVTILVTTCMVTKLAFSAKQSTVSILRYSSYDFALVVRAIFSDFYQAGYYDRGTQREYSSKPLKHSIVKRVLVFKR